MLILKKQMVKKEGILVFSVMLIFLFAIDTTAQNSCNQFSSDYRLCACMNRGFSERCCRLGSAAVDDPSCLAEAGNHDAGVTTRRVIREQPQLIEKHLEDEWHATFKNVYSDQKTCFESGVKTPAKCFAHAQDLAKHALSKAARCNNTYCRLEWTGKASQIAKATRRALEDTKVKNAKRSSITNKKVPQPVTKVNPRLQR